MYGGDRTELKGAGVFPSGPELRATIRGRD